MVAQNNTPLPDGLELAGYRIVKKIAAGGFSIVYLAEDAHGGAVALKEYLPSALALRAPGQFAPRIAEADQALFRVGLNCFFDEARALARVNHANVVRARDFFRANDTAYLVMAYESGRSLQQHIDAARDAGARLDEAFIRRTFLGVLRGLRALHASGLLHLDLKPANIHLRRDGWPVLLDFGAVRQCFVAGIPQPAPMFTDGFAAPELLAEGAGLGPWSDIYGVGAALFACMDGAPPAGVHGGEDDMARRHAALDGVYSPALRALVRACLMRDPDARPRSVFALQKMLGAPPSRPPPPAGLVARLRALGARLLVWRCGAPPA